MKKRRDADSHKSVRLCPCCARTPSDCTRQQQQISRRVGVKSANEIYEKHVRWQQQREARRLIEKQRAEEAQLQECTFRNPWFRSEWGPVDAQPTSSGNEAFYRRSVAWAERREQTLDAEKRIWQELEMMECTFRPRRGEAAGATQAAKKVEGRTEYAVRVGDHPSDSREGPQRLESPHLADYTDTDLEALASTSCSDWDDHGDCLCDSDECDGQSEEYSEQSNEYDGHSDEGEHRAPLLLRFSAADALEFAGR
jgi:hypothetical protein